MSSIEDAAKRHGVPPALVRSIIAVESGGDPWAMRYEPHYQWLWDWEGGAYRGDEDNLPSPAKVSTETELFQQKTSWGLMQVMGAVARQHGFNEPFCSALCSEHRGLHYGCRHLAHLYRRFGDEHGWEGVVAAFNAGSPRRTENGDWVNQSYVDKVLSEGGW